MPGPIIPVLKLSLDNPTLKVSMQRIHWPIQVLPLPPHLLSIGWLRAEASAVFQKIDVNRNKSISMEEFEAWWEVSGKGHGRGHSVDEGHRTSPYPTVSPLGAHSVTEDDIKLDNQHSPGNDCNSRIIPPHYAHMRAELAVRGRRPGYRARP